MKTLYTAIISFLFMGMLSAQTADTTHTQQNYYLVNTARPNKKVTIEIDGSLSLVQYDTVSNWGGGNVVFEENLLVFNGNIKSFDNTMLVLNTSEETSETYKSYMLTSAKTNSFFEMPKARSVQIQSLDGVYYSSRTRERARSVMFSIVAISAFTSLVVAPLASLEYKKSSTPGFKGFDRPMYFSIAGTGLFVAAVSIPVIFVLRPKYYSFVGDQYRVTKKKWVLVKQ